MTSSYALIPYPSSITPSTMRLIPMPIPCTPGAPYFDERGVSSFLNLILQHGSNAGINDADQLVSFIVRYSSDCVREITQGTNLRALAIMATVRHPKHTCCGIQGASVRHVAPNFSLTCQSVGFVRPPIVLSARLNQTYGIFSGSQRLSSSSKTS
jgi:hypothetical protein